MNIAVIAANGRSGKAFVEHALAAGHTIRAGIHAVNTLHPHKNLTTAVCDATKPEDVAKLIAGQDAVVSFIGHIKGSPDSVQTDTMRVLVQAMKTQNIRRIISLTGTGVRFPGDRITLIDRVLNAAIAIIDPKRIADGKNHVKVLQESALDWTILRVLKLQNTKPKPFMLKAHGPTKLFVSRDDVARAALQVLENNSFIHETPILSKI